MPVKHKSLFDLQIPECAGDILQIKDLHYSYPDGHQALNGIDLSVCEGEKVALVGPNGAGKSTLMLHLNGILGENSPITIADMSITKENLQVIRALVGLVFQNPDDQLFSPTVFDDVAFGPLHMGLSEEEVVLRVEEALEAVGMQEYGNRLSHHLSMGQKKRISIATVLAMRPHIMVLDEPSAGLDPRARRSLINFLRDLPITMLVSTHDLYMVKDLFPRMVIMDEGKIVADGPSMDILRNVSLLEAHGLESPNLV
ncbi:MAG: ATP-binding cassette domain-containing protein [Anaerolineales bacterium]|nr:MAG: ATP-binding cassette domain-containing protein [Anaerolineales bacterium]